MRLQISYFLVLFLSSFNALGVMIGFCPGTPPFGVIPCDTGCTGSSASNMASKLGMAELSMSGEFNNLNSEWVNAGNKDTDLITSYMLSKQLNSRARIQAYGAVDAKISNAISILGRENAITLDNVALSLETNSKNKISNDLQNYNIRHHGTGVVPTKIPLMLSKSVLMSDPINNKSFHSELLIHWGDEVNTHTKEEANTILLTTDDSALSILALDKRKLSIATSSELLKLLSFQYLSRDGSNTIASKKSRIKNLLAIELLLKSYDIDPEINDISTLSDIAINSFSSSEYQKKISNNKPRDLNIDLNVAQGIENVLLHDYLTLKKGKNIVRAFN